jgi:DNA-binding Lrp family transcriptional regulator
VDENRPSYYAIIPADVRYDDQIPANAKLLYGEISALISAEGYCYASNQYFSSLYGMAEETIARLITKLEKAGHIRRDMERDENGQIVKRKLYLRVSVPEIQPLDEKINTPPQKNQGGIDEKVKDTNLSISIKEKDKKEKTKREKKPKPETMTDEQLHEAVVSGIVQLSDPSWTKNEKNEIYRLTMALYDPNRVVKKAHPVRSLMSVNGTFRKLAKGGSPVVMIDMLNDAIIGGWQGVQEPRSVAYQKQPAEERVYKCV